MNTLVLAKLACPLLPFDHVARPRLVGQLSRLRRQRLICVCAPIGYGKTTLLVECMQAVDASESDVKTAWLTADSLDSDPERFWAHMRAALARMFPDLPGPHDDAVDVMQLCNALFSACGNQPGTEFMLFIDDFETASDAVVERQFIDFLSHMPASMHVVVAASHFSPLMQASSYQLGRASLDMRDLAFTRGEIKQFFEEEGFADLSEEAVESTMYWTEGWAQGIVLAAESALRMESSSLDGVVGMAKRSVRQYFSTQVLARVSPEMASCLVQLSILEVFSESMCEDVLDGDDVSDPLSAIIDENLFIVPCEDIVDGYRLHRLFADMLRADLQESDPTMVRSLSMRACIWYFARGEKDLAAKYLLLASDVDYIENLAEAICPLPRNDKRTGALPELLGTPACEMENSPLMCMMVVWSFVTNARLSGAREWVKKFEGCARCEEYRELITEKDIEFATKCLTMKCHAMDGEAEEALVMCDDLLSGAYVIEPSLMSMLYQSLGEIYERLGKMRQAQEVNLQGQAYASVDATKQQYYFNAYAYAHIEFLLGGNDDTIAHCRKLLRECPEDFALSGAISALLARALLEKNEREHVPEILASALRNTSPYRHADMYLEAKVAQTRYLISIGQLSEAYEAITEASMRGENRDIPRGVLLSVYCLQAEIASRRHNTRDLRVLERKVMPRVKSSDAYGMALMLMTRAFAARGNGEPDLALSFFDGAIEQAKRGGLVRTQLKALIEKALVLSEQGNDSRAQTILNDVLQLASRHGFVRSVLDAGEPMRALLRDRTVVRKTGDGVKEYVKMLLVEFEKDAPLDFSGDDSAPSAVDEDVATLTQRELEIFRLLNLGLSRQEIAESLCISVNTAKKHLGNIYAKLGVSTREEAIKKFYGNPFE